MRACAHSTGQNAAHMREQAQRWVFGGVAAVYAALVLSLLPWAPLPGYDTPYLIGIHGVTICAANLCTVLFLVRQYRLDGQPYLLALTAAYLLGALLVLPVALSFPGAFGPDQLMGHDTTSAILFLSWRVSFALLVLVGVVLGVRPAESAPVTARGSAVLAVVLGTAIVAGATISASLAWHMRPLEGGRFNPASFVAGWVVVALSLAGVG